MFEVNILSSEQEDLLKVFSTPSENKFLDVKWDMSEKRLPKIRGCIANFECVIHSIFPGGDHEIFVGNVIDYSYKDLKPLVLSKGRVISN